MIKTFKYKNANIRYKDQGKGIPIILLHGYLESLEIWDGFAAELIHKYRIVSIDIPGHGASGILGEIHTMEEMAGCVNYFLEILAIEKCILIGHSMGGYIVMAFLKLYAEKLLAFSLFHSTPFADTEEKKQNRDREIELIKEGKKETIYKMNIPKMFADDNLYDFNEKINEIILTAQKMPEKGIIALLNGMKNRSDHYEMLKNTNLPFLLILGKKDNYIPYETVSERIGFTRNMTKLILENSGHVGFIEEKDKSVLGVIRFIENL